MLAILLVCGQDIDLWNDHCISVLEQAHVKGCTHSDLAFRSVNLTIHGDNPNRGKPVHSSTTIAQELRGNSSAIVCLATLCAGFAPVSGQNSI